MVMVRYVGTRTYVGIELLQGEPPPLADTRASVVLSSNVPIRAIFDGVWGRGRVRIDGVCAKERQRSERKSE